MEQTRLCDRITDILNENGEMEMGELMETIFEKGYYPHIQSYGYIQALIDLGYLEHRKDGYTVYVNIKQVK
jgi:hypothetical protein